LDVCTRYATDYPATTSTVWTAGSGGTCDLGVFNDASAGDATRRLNFYRWLIDAQTVDHRPATMADLECATMQRENPGLSHSPPSSWNCYTAAGAGVAGRSNLSSASTPLGQLGSYLGEGASPYAFAHRRYLLGGRHDVGWVNTGGAGCNPLYFGAGGNGPSRWYSWPPAGVAPMETRPSWWQISSTVAFPAGFVVTVVDRSTGTPLSVTVNDLGSSWMSTDGMFAIGFRPIPTSSSGSYQVTITTSAGAPIYQYSVTFVSC